MVIQSKFIPFILVINYSPHIICLIRERDGLWDNLIVEVASRVAIFNHSLSL